MNTETTPLNRRLWKWILGGFALLLLAAYFVLAHFMGGPRDVYGFLRYALPQWHEGDLRVGEQAPDARIYSLDGRTAFHLRDSIGQRPLVLIFGSYT
ncbi:MAG TPA: hypothetical protein VGU63_07415 [Candidatus Acidoferrales bacterium]|nr:hypothetical protein [Candidatus Acidoferrales bacterium]